ncbi:Hypothetical protein ABZS17H1_03114 [Kosakonia cowanii]
MHKKVKPDGTCAYPAYSIDKPGKRKRTGRVKAAETSKNRH